MVWSGVASAAATACGGSPLAQQVSHDARLKTRTTRSHERWIPILPDLDDQFKLRRGSFRV